MERSELLDKIDVLISDLRKSDEKRDRMIADTEKRHEAKEADLERKYEAGMAELRVMNETILSESKRKDETLADTKRILENNTRMLLEANAKLDRLTVANFDLTRSYKIHWILFTSRSKTELLKLSTAGNRVWLFSQQRGYGNEDLPSDAVIKLEIDVVNKSIHDDIYTLPSVKALCGDTSYYGHISVKRSNMAALIRILRAEIRAMNERRK